MNENCGYNLLLAFHTLYLFLIFSYDDFFMHVDRISTGPEIIKLFSCSTQLSMKFQMLIKTIILTKKFLALSLSDVFIMQINVKIPTSVVIRRINFVLSWDDYEKSFTTSGPELTILYFKESKIIISKTMMHFCHEDLFLPLQTVKTLMKCHCLRVSRMNRLKWEIDWERFFSYF